MRTRFGWLTRAGIIAAVFFLLLRRWPKPQAKLDGSDQDGKPADRDKPDRPFKEPIHKGWQTEEEYHRCVERKYWLATILLTLAAAIGAGFSARYAFKAAREAHNQVVASQIANQMNAESGRAWITPIDASVQPILIGQALKFDIAFSNPGKEPAQKIHVDFQEFTVKKPSWQAATNLEEYAIQYADTCLSIDNTSGHQIAYTTNGFNVYHAYIDTNKTKEGGFVADEEIASGERFVIIEGCIIYVSNSKIRHSALCYLYKAGETDRAHLSICPAGNDAD